MTFRNKVLLGGTNTLADRVYLRTFLPELSQTNKIDIYCAQTHTEIIASLPISCNDNLLYTVTRAQRHTGTETHRQNAEKRSFDSQTQGQFSFREWMTCATEQFITQCSSSRQTEMENKEWEENRLGWRPWQAQCVRAFQPAGSYHSDHGRFTLRSLKPLPTATLMKKGIYHTQLQWRTTPKNTKHVCLLMSSCSCNYGSTEWQRRGFTEHIAADSAVAFQLKTHQSLAPLFSPGLHRGAAICHMARSHTPCTQCIQYMNRETNKRKEKKKKKRQNREETRGGMNIHTAQNAQTRPRALTSSSLLSSFILVTAT